jgi:glycosyltransferase involved in cell wall biosynthesis
MRPVRLAIVTTHPVQYNAPVFRCLAASGSLVPRVFYTWSQTEHGEVDDREFGATVRWDVPLTSGYDFEFVHNVAREPGRGFLGIRTPGLPRAIDRWHCDALLVYGWNVAAHLGVLRRFHRRVPVFFRGDSTLLDPAPPAKRALRRAVLRAVYRNVDVALAVGRNNADYFAWCGLPAARIAIVPHSIDVVRFAAQADGRGAEALAWRRRLGIPDERVVVLFAGKLVAKKAPERLVSAFLERGRGLHLVIAGTGELEPVLRAATAGRSDVHFLGFQNQSAMPVVYRLADLFVLPSVGPGETWGLALNEAMATGRAVAASSRVGGARDLVEEGRNGWTFAAGDDAALSRLLDDAARLGREGLRRMGLAGAAMAARWSSEESARRIVAAVCARVPRAAAVR